MTTAYQLHQQVAIYPLISSLFQFKVWKIKSVNQNGTVLTKTIFFPDNRINPHIIQIKSSLHCHVSKCSTFFSPNNIPFANCSFFFFASRTGRIFHQFFSRTSKDEEINQAVYSRPKWGDVNRFTAVYNEPLYGTAHYTETFLLYRALTCMHDVCMHSSSLSI